MGIGKFSRNIIVLLMLILMSIGSASAMIGMSHREDTQAYQWILVPAWLAGTWQTRFQTFFDSIDCTTGQRLVKNPTNVPVALVRTIGTQQDASGQIWHCAATPYVRSIETAGYYESQTIVQVSVLSSENNKLTLRTAGKVTRWLKGTRQTYDNFYEITDVAYSPMNEGVIKVEMTIKDFDTTGAPLHVSRSVCIERRIKPFAVINYDERGDLKRKFLEFQTETGAKQSVP